MKTYFVYILSNKTRTIYVGVTNNLEGRVQQHREGAIKGFSSKYKITSLVYYEEYNNVYEAISREKQIKAWRRSKKVALIKSTNPKWEDFSKAWVD